MHKLFLLVSTTLFAANCISQAINNPESVEYDATNNRYLVSNRATPISIQSLVPGQAPTLFASNVTGPAGLEILNGKLWVCDGGNLKSFDLTNGSLVDEVLIGGSFLNGITSDGVEYLYVSDYTAKKIYKINTVALTFTEIVANTVTSPNGMWYDGDNNRVLFVNWGSNAPIKAIDLTTFNVTTAATTTLGNCDGIARDAAGNYFVSAWSQGAVYRFDANLANPVAVVTGLTQPADIYYNTQNDTLVVPQTSADVVSFHNFSTASLDELHNSKLYVKIYPNPAHDVLNLQIDATEQNQLILLIRNAQGAIVVQKELDASTTELQVELSTYASGQYFYELKGLNSSVSGCFVRAE